MILIELRASEDLEGGYANIQMTPEGTKNDKRRASQQPPASFAAPFQFVSNSA